MTVHALGEGACDVCVPTCCAVCQDKALDGVSFGWLKRTFIVCADCGNKRCPKASAHWQACTRSNEPGQAGSFYGPEESWPVHRVGGEP